MQPHHSDKSPRPTTPKAPTSLDNIPLFKTPKKPEDIVEAINRLNHEAAPLSRNTKDLLNKTTKTVAKLNTTIAQKQALTSHLTKKLTKHAPNKQQDVERNKNKVFSGLYKIRSAQDKRNKRLPPLPNPDIIKLEDPIIKEEPKSKKPQRS